MHDDNADGKGKDEQLLGQDPMNQRAATGKKETNPVGAGTDDHDGEGNFGERNSPSQPASQSVA